MKNAESLEEIVNDVAFQMRERMERSFGAPALNSSLAAIRATAADIAQHLHRHTGGDGDVFAHLEIFVELHDRNVTVTLVPRTEHGQRLKHTLEHLWQESAP